MFTIQQLYNNLAQYTSTHKFLIAYSGGIDSQALLYAMAKLREENKLIQLRAVHVNHGLSPNADKWELHCKTQCEALDILFVSKKIKLQNNSDSIEEQARNKRYEIFAKLLDYDECLLTAHNKNDQAETLLLQLLRGAGVKGLSAMPAKKQFKHGYLLRPFLNFTRSELEQFAAQHQLQWIEDESNIDPRFDRNFLRHQVVPILQQRWPSMVDTLARTATHCAGSVELLDDLAAMDLAAAKTDVENVLKIESLMQLSEARLTNVLRYWLHQLNVLLPDTRKLNQILQDIFFSSIDATPCVQWSKIEVRRYRDQIYCLSQLLKHDASIIIQWDLQSDLELPNHLGKLSVKKIKGQGFKQDIPCNKLTIRFRQGGEKIQPVGRKETHVLKKLFQDWGVPPWERERIPLIYMDDQLIAVVGFCVAEGFQVGKDDDGLIVEFN